MNVIFRTDASLNIGTGHVMRCLTLAAALRKMGSHCIFICREHEGNLCDQIHRRGFDVIVLQAQKINIHNQSSIYRVSTGESEYISWIGADWSKDAEESISHIADYKPDWLIVDHYALDIRWEKELRPNCRKLMIIDDLANREHDCDLLMDQNFGRTGDEYEGLVPAKCKFLIGPQYALLRPEFADNRNYSLSRRIRPSLAHLLISMGGVDRDNFTAKILDALNNASLPLECRITVVLGPHSPWISQISKQAESMSRKTQVLVNIANMANLMAESDLCIGAAGGEALERCCLGLPAIILILAENQRAGATALANSGCAYLTESGEKLQSSLTSALRFIQENDNLSKMSVAAAQVTRGVGVEKLVNCLTQ